MTTREWRNALAVAVLGAALLTAPGAHAALGRSCLTGNHPEVAMDAPQITALRAAVDSACVCADFDGGPDRTHRDYTRCVKDEIRAAVAAGELRAECSRKVREIFNATSCGTEPELNSAPCLTRRASDGRLDCKILPTTRRDGVTPSNRCRGASRVVCGDHTSCLEAGDENGDLVIAAPGDSGACVAPTPDPTGTPTPTPTPTPTATPTLTPTRAPFPIDCVVTDWGPWGTCSQICGGGMQSRVRQVLVEPQFGGAACPSLSETQSCNVDPCA